MSENKRRRRPETLAASSIPEPEYANPYAPTRQPQYDAPPPPPPVQDNRTVIVNQIGAVQNTGFGDQSYFDGGLLSLIGWNILAFLLIIFTLGLAFPFAACMLYRWEARHTVINGRRLVFDGSGWQLFGKWILWMILTIVTLGIYSLWLGIKLKQWRVYHTHFA